MLLIFNLIKNACPSFLINKVIKKCLNHKFFSDQNQLKDTYDVCYFKLSCIGNLLHISKVNFAKNFVKKDFNITLVFNSFEIKNYVKTHIRTRFLIILNIS